MKPWPYPAWLAHRGAGKLAPENTLAAFRLGAGFGFRAFECDVKLSRDGEAFLLHDDTLDRTTDGRGSPADVDWADLARLDAGNWHSPAFAAEPLPRLTQIAAFCLANGCALNIEIKPCPGTDRLTGERVAAEAARLWAGHDGPPPLLSSFSREALAAAALSAPALPRALLLEALPPEGPVAAARTLGCVAVVMDHRLMSADHIAALHAAGLRALVYTVNDTARADELRQQGLDGLITDAVDRLGPGATASPSLEG